MPELPEVEVCRLGLQGPLKNAVIESGDVRTARLRREVSENLIERLRGRRIADIVRRGKYLLFECRAESGRGWLLVHLGMTGNLLLCAEDVPAQKHDHIDFRLNTVTGRRILRYRDPRRFGLVLWIDDDDFDRHPLLAGLGAEPLEPAFNGRWLYENTRKRRMAVKQYLMASRFIVGIGNIYAAEALFAAGISPLDPADSLAAEQCDRLVAAIRQTLEAAIRAGGSSIRDYVHSDGGVGNFQLDYAVYGRDGLPCPRCGAIIVRLKQHGRSSFYCPGCQNRDRNPAEKMT